MPSFLDEMKASFPATLPLPPELETTLAWLEANGCVHAYKRGGRYASLFPEGSPTTSQLLFQPCEPSFARLWTGSDKPEVAGRMAMFLRTGGDGSRAGLWRDDFGRLRVVHCGSGSGSIFNGVLVDSVVDLLRLLAIGYEELCWPDDYARTPVEIFEEQNEFDDESFEDPAEFRAFVESRFGVSTPRTAAEIVRASASADPFRAWLERERR